MASSTTSARNAEAERFKHTKPVLTRKQRMDAAEKPESMPAAGDYVVCWIIGIT
jgi:hypothetical protein